MPCKLYVYEYFQKNRDTEMSNNQAYIILARASRIYTFKIRI